MKNKDYIGNCYFIFLVAYLGQRVFVIPSLIRAHLSLIRACRSFIRDGRSLIRDRFSLIQGMIRLFRTDSRLFGGCRLFGISSGHGAHNCPQVQSSSHSMNRGPPIWCFFFKFGEMYQI